MLSFLPIHQHLAIELDNRLSLLKHQPKQIILYGSDAGNSTKLLRKRYPKAVIQQYDERKEWLNIDQHNTQPHLLKQLTTKKVHYHQQAWQHPLPSQQADMLWSNLALMHTTQILPTFKNWAIALQPYGTLFFTHLGRDSIPEIKAIISSSFPQVLNELLLDMHDLADMLHHNGFYDAVVDTSKLVLEYQSITSLIHDLTLLGIWQILFNQQLTHLIEQAYFSGSLRQITLETIYGHAIKKPESHTKEHIIQFMPRNT